MAVVEQLGLGDDRRWYVQLAARWRWYLPLCIVYLHNICKFSIVSVHSFFIFFFSLVSIN